MWTTELKEDLDSQGLVIIKKDQLAQLKKDKDQFFNEKLELEQELMDLKQRMAGTWNEKDRDFWKSRCEKLTEGLEAIKAHQFLLVKRSIAMPFDDNDLKRWKEYYEGAKQAGNQHIDLRLSDMQALLFRLEAAEACLLDGGLSEKEKDERFEAWRKACGK